MEEVSKEEGLLMALERKAHELEDKVVEQHADLCAQDRKIDELEAKIRELEARNLDAMQHIDDLHHLVESADRNAKKHTKEMRELNARIEELDVLVDYWRDRFHCLQDGITGGAQ